MKKIAAAALIAATAATAANAGALVSSAGILIPLFLLVLLGVAAAN